MRTLPSDKSGALQTRTFVIVLVLVLVAGLGVLRLNRATRKSSTPPAESLSGPLELSRTNLVLEDGRLRQPGSAAPFRGFLVEHYPDGTSRSRSAISNGVLNGVSQGWYTNGQIQVTEHFKDGVSHGARTKWYLDGTKQSEAEIVEGKLHGTFRKWHENGALSEQVEFVADKAEGVSRSYFPSGYLKARVVMKDGRTVEQNFWKDGEKKE